MQLGDQTGVDSNRQPASFEDGLHETLTRKDIKPPWLGLDGEDHNLLIFMRPH